MPAENHPTLTHTADDSTDAEAEGEANISSFLPYTLLQQVQREGNFSSRGKTLI